ncbi:hypothetical protein JXA80_02505 [bacterium]|nr:hypothetical protein [candidate division CSSED10-310 bacterium]
MMLRLNWDRIRQSITANPGLKTGSLILAIILWITITGQGTADRIVRDIPYQIKSIPQGMELTDKGTGVIQVRIRGPKSLIPTLKPSDITISLKLPEDVEPGEVPLRVTSSSIITPYSNQLSILQIVPDTVTVTLDRVIQKSVRIQPFLRGSPNADYELGESRVSPPHAVIEGPYSALESIEVVYTEPIDVLDQTLSFDDRVQLKPQNALIRIITPSRVTARVEIRERITERSFPEFEITAVPQTLASDFIVTPPVVTLTIIGPASMVNRLKPTDIQLVADCAELMPGDHMIRPVLVAGESRITLVSIDPDTVIITIPEPVPTATPSTAPLTDASATSSSE